MFLAAGSCPERTSSYSFHSAGVGHAFGARIGGMTSATHFTHPAGALGAAQVPAARLTGLPPVVDARTAVLVLGSFPGAASLRAAQYYAHPQNQFWPIVQSLWPQHALPPREDYAGRCAWLLARGLGLWDVYGACEREGSLDAAIRHAEVNDFAALRARCPQLAAIAHNGGESHKHARSVLAALAGQGAAPQTVLQALRLPSTSPAFAAWNMERKRNAWAEALAPFGLV
jgi:hypoxanthine-DNA glycosylase